MCVMWKIPPHVVFVAFYALVTQISFVGVYALLCGEKLTKNCVCGEKMTNIRYGRAPDKTRLKAADFLLLKFGSFVSHTKRPW